MLRLLMPYVTSRVVGVDKHDNTRHFMEPGSKTRGNFLLNVRGIPTHVE